MRIRTRATNPPAPEASRPNTPSRMARLETWDIGRLRLPPRRLRRPGKGQAEALQASIGRFGLIQPIIVSPAGEIIDGAILYEAAKALGYRNVPVAIADNLSDAEVKALRIALNRIPERSTWDDQALALELQFILDEDPLLATFTGFEMPEIDRQLGLAAQPVSLDGPPQLQGVPVSRVGDLWLIGPHRLLCGDAKDPNSYLKLLEQGIEVQMILSDVPYGVRIGDISSSHREFVEGSDLTEAELTVFFRETMRALSPHVPSGCIVDLFIDHRGMYALTTAIREIGLEHICTAIWVKGAGGMGGLYRHAAEYVLVLKRPGAKNINNVQLGAYGRNRTTVWEAPGYASFGPDRAAALAMHPTCKPVSLLKDAILDTSNIGGVILDMFAGSGSTLVAAHQVQRIGVGIELDPLYADQSVRRLQEVTGELARHAETGLTFDETAAQRLPLALEAGE